MADKVITASAVFGSGQKSRKAGEAITAGQAYFIDAADSAKAKLCDATDPIKAVFVGVALNDAALNQPFHGVEGRNAVLTCDAVFTIGEIVYASATPGGIAPLADVSLGTDYVTVLGVALTTTTLELVPVATGVQDPA